MSIDTDIVIDEKVVIKETVPPKYNVILLNDEHTPIDFVIRILQQIFKHSQETSEQLTMKIHNEGSAVVGTYNYEVAEMKGNEVLSLGRNNGFPLQCKLEETE